jgi:hypothetical protein
VKEGGHFCKVGKLAESSLTITFSDLVRHVSRYLGWGRTAEYSTGTIAVAAGTVTLSSGTWPSWAAAGTLLYNGTFYTVASRTSNSVIVLDDTSLTVVAGATYTLFNNTEDEAKDLIDIVKTGQRNVYVPPAIDGYSHRWSFMDPVTTLSTVEPYDTGTVTIVAGTATLAGGTWPSWAASGDLVVDGVPYSVASRTSNSVIVLDDTSATAAALTEYSLQQQAYDLPDDFGGMIGPLTFRPGGTNFQQEIVQRGEAEIRRMQATLNVASAPQYYALRPKLPTASTSAGQRWELIFNCPTDDVYVLSYRYTRNPNTISTANQYAYGGLILAEVLKESCLAEAELMIHDRRGEHEAQFLQLLKAAIEKDRLEMTPDSLGVAGSGRMREGQYEFTPSVQVNFINV